MSQSGDETYRVIAARVGAAKAHVKWGTTLSWALTLVGLGALALYLALSNPPRLATSNSTTPQVEVRVTDRQTLRLPSSGPFAQQLRRITVSARPASTPLIEATGTLLAAPSVDGTAQAQNVGWQFADAELLSIYSELLQADADVAFQARQAHTTRTLHDTKIRTQAEVVDRLRRLVEVGSESARALAAEEANLLERRIEGERAIHEVDNARKAAERKQAALVRQFEQAGLPPDLLRRAARGRFLVVAEIPESRSEQVREEQSCAVGFFGHPKTPRTGKVVKILPTVSTAQRTLRVVIVLNDADASLRPGMFARVGLGTEARDALVVPQSALLHVGRADYVLVSTSGEATITQVTLGEARGIEIEIVTGLKTGDTVISDGAILLKPAVVQALQALAARGAAR